ncbi:MAG TPA: 1-(5-phosphoribosyl)-5-[(5-phosphoribosylamino)methylideneamino] imidazole-4-carboxamide isomerase [Longimicrobiales bacterium]|nr:1-(5-phosphoribosyl)-5-[(5-phosphoribosylamino)methylideneamino] imidazole-4-carboxamide isomerase [Longimicrobiales bacterium]
MIAYAAIDLRGGRVVQLVGGEPGTEQVSLPDPGAVTRRWVDAGFAALHVVDLDAALGAGYNADAVSDILRAAGDVPVQVGGGVRDTAAAEALLAAGAARVVAGTRAVEDRAWLDDLATRFPGRVVVAADIRGDEVVVRGWTAGSGLDALEFLRGLAPLPLAGVLVTDVTREGRMLGTDTDRFARLIAAAHCPLLASGGVAGPADLVALEEAGAAGVVLGMALYTGALDAQDVATRYRT